MNLSIDALSLSVSAIYILVSSHSLLVYIPHAIVKHPKGGGVLWKLAGLGVVQTMVESVLESALVLALMPLLLCCADATLNFSAFKWDCYIRSVTGLAFPDRSSAVYHQSRCLAQ